MEFLWPFSIFALLLPFFIRYIMRPIPQKNGEQALCVPFFKAFQNKSKTFIYSRSNLAVFLFVTGFVCLVIAAMRPVTYKQAINLPVTGRQLMLVLDVSGSMEQRDFIWNNRQTTRLNAVQNIAYDFIENRTGDAVGLTIFGQEAYLYAPLTLDTKTVAQMLKEIGVGIAGERTAIGDALLVALKQMKDIPSDKKVIILLSDGFANAGIHPEEAIEIAKQRNVKIHTIGMGSDKQLINDFFFPHEINPSADLDEALLKKIAQETNGTYFRVKTSEDLKKVYDALDKIEPTEINGPVIRPQEELFWVPLFLSMILFFVGLYLKRKNG